MSDILRDKHLLRTQQLDHAAPNNSGDSDTTHSSGNPAARSGPLEQEFTETYRSNAARLFRYGLLLTRNRSLAQEAVQETFLKYYVRRKEGVLESDRAWLFRVLRNFILDEQKSMENRLSVTLEEAVQCEDSAQSPEQRVELSETIDRVRQLLSPRELECLQLRAEGFSYKQIGVILGVEPGAVGAFLARGANKIRNAFGKEK